jgi:LPXTG-motif cell wall-anchored protein
MVARLGKLLVAVALVLGIASVGGGAPAGAASLPPIKHVFVIVLENKGFDETFGSDSKAPYLANELPKLGQVLTNFYGTGHASLTNYVAMVSGQAPTKQTQQDCLASYDDVKPATPSADGQVVGEGCVYPASVKTIADQLTAKGLTWKGYMQDMGTPCRHAAPGTPDSTIHNTPGDQYAARHNPFVYFHSILDGPDCAKNDVDLSNLQGDLSSAATTANYSFITPNVCEDAHDGPCVDAAPGGLQSADGFLKTWVPRIMSSPAYADGGMLVVTFDEAQLSDSTACCNEPSGPNVSQPGFGNGPGGGRTGTVIISSAVPKGTLNATPMNHYSMLRGVEDLFGLEHLGYAGQTGLVGIDSVFDATRTPSTLPRSTTTTVRRVGAGSELPRTGSTNGPLLAFAMLFLASGTVLIIGGRRKTARR